MYRNLRKKEAANQRFMREELGSLLKLFSSLGITITLCIVGSFLLGRYINSALEKAGVNAYGAPTIILVLAGIALAFMWSSMRIARHLQKFNNTDFEDRKSSERKRETDKP